MDYALPVRRAVLTFLKADGPLIALVPASRQYPSTTPANPTYPLIRYGTPSSTPFVASFLDSSATRFTLHGFSAGLISNGALLETAEDNAQRIGAAIKRALNRRVLPLEGGMTATLTWLASTCFRDRDEQDKWHATVDMLAEVAG